MIGHGHLDTLGVLEVGAGYGLLGALLDEHAQTATTTTPTGRIPFVNAAQLRGEVFVRSWDEYIGQESLKQQMRVHINSAHKRGRALDHIMLASPPGYGKSTLARLISATMGGDFKMLVPPFTADTLYEAALSMRDGGCLFIDEIHLLMNQRGAAENLLHMLEERTLYLDDGVHRLADFTVIAATTEKDRLPETILDRFSIKPTFAEYSLSDLIRITHGFAKHYGLVLIPGTMVAIAKACLGTPRIARELTIAARDLRLAIGRSPTPMEVLRFKEIDPDGMTAQHRAYLLGMYRFFGREGPHGWEHVAGEYSMMTMLRETKPGLARLERWLISAGLVDRTPRGRRLTPAGVARAAYLHSRAP